MDVARQGGLARDPHGAGNIIIVEIRRILIAIDRHRRRCDANLVIGLSRRFQIVGDRRRNRQRRRRLAGVEGGGCAGEVVTDRLDALAECRRVARAIGDRRDTDRASLRSSVP